MPSSRPRGERKAVVWAALALFLLGTNYCFLGTGIALAGGHAPACHAAPMRTMASDECCHARASGQPAPNPQPAKLVFPCCILLAPPSALSLDPGPAAEQAVVLQAAVAAALVEPPFPSRLGRPPDRASSPPSPPERAPLGCRAPPLA